LYTQYQSLLSEDIPVAKGDIPKTAITTSFSMYKFLNMSFDLRNAAQTFQRFIDSFLEELDFCYAYIDDILVASSSLGEHYKYFKILLRRLVDYGVLIIPKKCVFG